MARATGPQSTLRWEERKLSDVQLTDIFVQDSLWHIKDEAGGGHGYVTQGETALTQDYAHYPRPEEYLVSPDTSGQAKLWQYTMGNGDQYAVPNKIKSQPLEKINSELESWSEFVSHVS